MTTTWKELFSFIMVKDSAVSLSWVFRPVWRVAPHTVCRGCRISCWGPGCHGNQHWPIWPSWWWLGPEPSWLLCETESSSSQAAPDDQRNRGSGGQRTYSLSLWTLWLVSELDQLPNSGSAVIHYRTGSEIDPFPNSRSEIVQS